MTLKEIHEYIGPLLHDESFANQSATLIIHCSDGDITPSIAESAPDEIVAKFERERRMLPHKQVKVKVGDMEDDVDEELAPLIEELWKAKIATHMSCQENPVGFAWIVFNSANDLCMFLNIVGDYEPTFEDNLYSRLNMVSENHDSWWEYDMLLYEYGFQEAEGGAEESHDGVPAYDILPSIRFPRSELPILLKRMTEQNAEDQEWLKELD
jgi:hypothetical protein